MLWLLVYCECYVYLCYYDCQYVTIPIAILVIMIIVAADVLTICHSWCLICVVFAYANDSPESFQKNTPAMSPSSGRSGIEFGVQRSIGTINRETGYLIFYTSPEFLATGNHGCLPSNLDARAEEIVHSTAPSAVACCGVLTCCKSHDC